MNINELKELVRSLRWDSGWDYPWKRCMEVGLKIFQVMPIQLSLNVAYQYLEEYFIVFDHYHPDAKWVYERLNTVATHLKSGSKNSLGKFLLPEEQSEFATPGSNGFINKLENLWELTSVTEAAYIKENVFFIVSGIITCKLDERWGNEDPEAWQQWYTRALDYTSEAGSDQRVKFVSSSSIGRQAGLEWIILANRIESIVGND